MRLEKMATVAIHGLTAVAFRAGQGPWRSFRISCGGKSLPAMVAAVITTERRLLLVAATHHKPPPPPWRPPPARRRSGAAQEAPHRGSDGKWLLLCIVVSSLTSLSSRTSTRFMLGANSEKVKMGRLKFHRHLHRQTLRPRRRRRRRRRRRLRHF